MAKRALKNRLIRVGPEAAIALLQEMRRIAEEVALLWVWTGSWEKLEKRIGKGPGLWRERQEPSGRSAHAAVEGAKIALERIPINSIPMQMARESIGTELLRALLQHAAYSFADINYSELTTEEKTFITPEIFNHIKTRHIWDSRMAKRA